MLLAAALVWDLSGVVRWDAPPGCPVELAVQAAVERYVGRALADEVVQAQGVVEGDAGSEYRLRLTVTRGGETDLRTLHDADCSVLADAAAVVIAMAIDPDATAAVIAATQPEPEPEPEPAPTPQPVPTPAADPVDNDPAAVSPRPPPRDRPTCRPGPSLLRAQPRRLTPQCGAVGVSLPLQLGPLPRFGAGVSGHAALLWPRLRLEAGGSFYFPQRALVDDMRGGDIRLVVGHVRACGRLGVGAIAFPLCGGVEAGVMHGQGVALNVALEDRLPWAAGLADAGVAWAPQRWIALRAQVGAVVPFARYRFQIAGVDPRAHQASPVGLRLGIGVEGRFP